MLNGDSIEDINIFTYLGSVVSKNGVADEDIKARLRKAKQAFVTLSQGKLHGLHESQTFSCFVMFYKKEAAPCPIPGYRQGIVLFRPSKFHPTLINSMGWLAGFYFIFYSLPNVC